MVTKLHAFSTNDTYIIRNHSRISVLINTRITSNRVRYTIHVTQYLKNNFNVRPHPQVIKNSTFKRARTTNSLTNQRLIIFERRLPRRVHRITVPHTRIVRHRTRVRLRTTLFSNNKSIPTSLSILLLTKAVQISSINDKVRQLQQIKANHSINSMPITNVNQIPYTIKCTK